MSDDPIDEFEAQKRAIYEKISPRRRKFIDKIGYESWNPFQKPFDPIDIRQDPTKRTTQQLMNEFLGSRKGHVSQGEYLKGAWEACVGLINSRERQIGMRDFVLWYTELLEKEGQSKNKAD